MFFLWGILIASPMVAGSLLVAIWFGHLLLVPMLEGDDHEIRWNRPSFYLALLTTVVAGSVIGVTISNAMSRGNASDLLLIAMNASAGLLVLNVVIVVIECWSRRTMLASNVWIFAAFALLVSAGLSWLLLV